MNHAYSWSGCAILLLKGQCPAEISFKQLKHTFPEVSSESKDLDQLLHVCLIKRFILQDSGSPGTSLDTTLFGQFSSRTEPVHFKTAYLLKVCLSAPAYSGFEANN